MGAHYALSLCWQFRFPIYSRKQVNLSNRWIPRLKPGNSGPVTPPTFPRSEGKAEPDRADARVYMGTIVRDGDTYVLKSGNAKYLLDSQKKAKTYKGKDVNVTGTLDKGEKFDSR